MSRGEDKTPRAAGVSLHAARPDVQPPSTVRASSKLLGGIIAVVLLTGCVQETSVPQSPCIEARRQPAADRIEFAESYAEGLAEARRTGRPVLLFFRAPGCVYCESMFRDVFSHERVADLATDFVCIEVDVEESPEICRQYRVSNYPTVQILSSRGTSISRSIGKQKPTELAVQLQAAIELIAARQERDVPPTLIR